MQSLEKKKKKKIEEEVMENEISWMIFQSVEDLEFQEKGVNYSSH